LDVLINNAGGIMGRQMQLTKEGFEKTFAVNLLAPFLLTTQLLEHLGKGDEGRIINVSSNSHELNAKPDFNDLQMKRRYTPLGAYGNSKLFLIWISQHLSKDLKDTLKERITVNTVHPGAVRTGFGTASDLGSVLNFISKLARPFFRTPEQGADTVVYLATNKEVGTVSGKYFVDRKQAKVSAKYYSNEREQQIWDYCKSLLAHHLV
jgi:NAD(P)-dependent dehydrogenase (short-subunit alcohol dehydrogenase family)